MKKALLAVPAVLLMVAAAATAEARVDLNFNVGLGVPAPQPAVVEAYPAAPPQVVVQQAPQFIYSPDLGMYVSVESPYDVVYSNGGYYRYYNGYWFLSPSYEGPWSAVPLRRLPPGLRQYRYEQIRHFRDRQYRVYLRDRDDYRGNWYRPVEARDHRWGEWRHEQMEHREREWERHEDHERWEHDRR